MVKAGRQKKYREPPGYRPPASADELLERYSKGERYFARARLRGALLSFRQFKYVNFTGADLRSAQLDKSVFVDADFTDARLVGARLDKASLLRCSFARANLSGSYLYHAMAVRVNFFLAQIEGAQQLETVVFHEVERGRLPASREKGSSCFVSYTNKDRFPRYVERELRRAGVPHWFQLRSSYFDSNVAENLARSVELCDIFVFLLTANALASEYVQYEIERALRLSKQGALSRIVTLRTGRNKSPDTGPMAALSDHQVIDCSGGSRAGGVAEFIRIASSR